MGCQNLPAEVEWILFCNADGSDDIGRVPEMLAATETGAELVLGTRSAGEDGNDHLTSSQRFGNKLATTLIQLLWGAKYGDLGLVRLISRRAFEQLKMQDRGFGWTVEMQVRASIPASFILPACVVPVFDVAAISFLTRFGLALAAVSGRRSAQRHE